MNYEIIRTGSDGNCVILNGFIAVDMGISFKEIEPKLKAMKLVLLTHVHG